jgi:hypothetical protein
MYLFVHNKSCNHLGVKKVEALVYIYTNSKFLGQSPGANLVLWYENNIFSKNLDLDNDGRWETNSLENDGYILANGAQL